MLCLAPLGGCGSEPPEAVIEIRARIIDDGVATPFLSLGRVTSSAVVEVTDARFELAPRSANQAVAFVPGCFALQLSGAPELSLSAEGTLQVAPSRSLYNQSRGLPSDAEVVPLLASGYRFEGLDSPLEGREFRWSGPFVQLDSDSREIQSRNRYRSGSTRAGQPL